MDQWPNIYKLNKFVLGTLLSSLVITQSNILFFNQLFGLEIVISKRIILNVTCGVIAKSGLSLKYQVDAM